jgi:hypothetical protein
LESAPNVLASWILMSSIGERVVHRVMEMPIVPESGLTSKSQS